MANCISCGVHYCDCPTPGYCPTCLNKMFAESHGDVNPNCPYTIEIIKNFNDVFSRILAKGAGPRVGLNAKDNSFYQSYLNSAMMSPNNPCQYKNVLDNLKPIIELAIAFGI
jgi:hypothetical protein